MDAIESAISDSIAGMSGSDTPVSDTTESTDTAVDESPATDDAPLETSDAPADGDPAPPAPVAEAPVADAAPEAKEETLDTLKEELAGKRDNRIPYSRMTKIVANQVRKAEEAVRTQYAQYETPEFQNGLQALRVADESPEQFIQALVQADPRYAELLAGSKVLGVQQAAPAARQAAPQIGGDVQPDIQLSDGTLGYSAEATAKLLEQREARMSQQFDSMLKERLKGIEPIERAHKQSVLRQEAATAVQSKIRAAQQWPGFAENQQAIAQVVADATKQRKSMDLHEAYIQVVYGKMQSDKQAAETAGYQKALAEINKKAKGASGLAPGSAAAQPVTPVVGGDVDPITAAIMDSIRKR